MDSAIFYYQKALHFATEGGLKYRIAAALGNIALAFKTQSKNDSALAYYEKSIKVARENGAKELMARNLIDLSYLKTNKGDNVDAVKLLFEARQIGEELSNPTLLSLVYSALAFFYRDSDKVDQVLQYHKLAIHYDLLENEIYSLPIVYLNLGETYRCKKKDTDSAMYYFKLCLETARPFEKENLQLAVDINIGNLHFDKKNYDSAYYYFIRANDNPLNNKFPEKKASSITNLGVIYYFKHDLEKASSFLNKGYRFSDSLDLANIRLVALKWLISLDSVQGNYAMAFHRHKLYQELLEKSQSVAANNRMIELEIDRDLQIAQYNNQYLYKENDLKSQQIKNQKIINAFSLLLLIGSIVFTIIQIRNVKKISALNKKLIGQHKELQKANENLSISNELLLTHQQKLEEVNKSKDKFVSILSHDLKSPFNGLLGLLEYLKEDWENLEDKAKQEIVTMLHQSTKSTFGLLEELLNWGKSQQGLIVCQPSILSVLDVLNEIKSLYDNSLVKKSIHLRITIEPKMKINTDRRLLTQVIQNFVGNAIKYTTRGGNIEISGQSDGERDSIFVTDFGIGIPANKLSNLFDLDADFGRPGTEDESSTGMGLILCKEYARIMNASLEVHSEVGKGSTFSICFLKSKNT